MNQRSVDPEVQAVRLVRRRPMSASNSAPQTPVRWVNVDCFVIRKSNQFFFLKSHWKRDYFFCKLSWTELGFRSMKSRNKIKVMMMMTTMILIIESLHVRGWSVQHCGLSIRSPWTQLKQQHLRTTFAITSNADIIHRFHFATDREFDAGWIVRHWNPWLVPVLILVYLIVLDEGGLEKCVGHEGKCLICQLKTRFL